MENTQRIKAASRRLRYTCMGLFFFLPVISALFWVFFNQIHNPASNWSTSMISLPVRVTGDLPALPRFLAFLSELIPLSALLYGLRKLKDLFHLYENGIIFSARNVACFRSLGKTLIAWVICDLVKNAMLSIALTINNPPGQRMITLGLYSADFTAAFVGIVILIIAWVMDEGRKIKEDQDLFI